MQSIKILPILLCIATQIFALSFDLAAVSNLRSVTDWSKEKSIHGSTFNRAGIISLNRSRSAEDDAIIGGMLLTADTLTLQLFNDLTVSMEKQSYHIETDGGIFWTGTLIRGEGGYIQLYYNNQKLSGTLYGNDLVYTIEPETANLLKVVELNPAKNPQEEECEHDDDGPEDAFYANLSRMSSRATSENTIIDVMILYPSALGTKSSMDAKVKEYIAQSNQIFLNSEVNVTFRLVHHDVNNNIPAAAQSVDDVKNASGVSTLRTQYGADIVSHWNSGGKTGTATNGSPTASASTGFNTCNYSEVQSKYTFTHESGHNLGAKHDRIEYINDNRTNEFNISTGKPGYQFGKCFKTYRTVMAYNNCKYVSGGASSCNRVPYFSSPTVMYNGVATGIAEAAQVVLTADGPADNARRINDCAPNASNWMATKVALVNYTLTVNKGTGNADLTAFAAAVIAADDSSSIGREFSHWTGGKGAITDSTKAITTISMPENNLTITAVYKGTGVQTYKLIIREGTSSGKDTITAAANSTITIVANDSSFVGREFSHWSGAKGVINDSTKATATITMPENNLTVTANYKNSSVATHTLTLINGTTNGKSSVTLATGVEISITANAPASDKIFDYWSNAKAANITDSTKATTIITMPDNDITITAVYKNRSSDTYELSIEDGFGSGLYKSGDKIRIYANRAPAGFMFAGWQETTRDDGTDDTESDEVVIDYLEDNDAIITTLTMPERDIYLSAVWAEFDSTAVITELIPIAVGTDDAEEYGTNATSGKGAGYMYITSTDLELTEDGSKGNQFVGMRFTDIPFNEGIEILESKLLFIAKDNTDGECLLNISIENNTDAQTFSSDAFNISGREYIEKTVPWTPEGWTADEIYESPDISELIADLYAQNTADERNNIVFMIDGTGKRRAFAYEGSEEKVVMLLLQYRPKERSSGISNKQNKFALSKKTLSVYMAAQNLNIQVPTNGQYSVQIFSVSGRMITNQKMQFSAGVNKIPMKNMSAGAYVCRITAPSGINITKKLIRQ